MTPAGYRIRWFALFAFPDLAEKNRWYKGPQGIGAAIDLLAATPLWPELQVFGSGFQEGVPLTGDLDALKERIASGPGMYVLARGAPRAAAHTEEAEVAVEIDLSPRQVELKLQAGGAALDRLGARFLDEVTGVLVRLLHTWRGKANLVRCAAVPVADPKLVYPRPRPPRVAARHRPLGAIVDIVLVDPVPDGADPDAVAESRAIAGAPPPAGVVRTEHAGVVVLRWVEDPRDASAVATATGRHEAWMAGLVPTKLLLGWNEHGDRQVTLSSGAPRPPFRVVDDATGVGYLEVAAGPDGEVAPDEWARVEALAGALPEGVRALALVAPSREAALALSDRARSLGIVKVLHAQGKPMWDPDPPGPWLPSGGT